MNKTGELDYFWMSIDDMEYCKQFSYEAVGGGFKAAMQYAFDGIEPQNLDSDEQKVFERLKKRVDDTRDGFDPYAE